MTDYQKLHRRMWRDSSEKLDYFERRLMALPPSLLPGHFQKNIHQYFWYKKNPQMKQGYTEIMKLYLSQEFKPVKIRFC